MSYAMSTGPSDNNDENDGGPSMKDKDKYTEEKNDKNAIIAGLNQLREQQKIAIIEITRMEDDKRELERVLQVLKKMESDRKCFRMVGTTLVQQDIRTVLPVLESTLENLDTVVNSMKDNVIEKGKELEEYTAKHKIRYVSEKELREQAERNAMKK